MERTSPLWGLDSSHPSPERGVRKSSRTGSSLPNRVLGAEPALSLLARLLGVSRWQAIPSLLAARPETSQLRGAGAAPARWPGISCTRPRASLPRPCPSPPAPPRTVLRTLPRRLGTAPGSSLAASEPRAPGRPGSVQHRRHGPARAREVEARAGPRGPGGSRGAPARDPAALTAEQQQQQQPKLRAPPLSHLHGRMAAARGRLRPGWVRGGRRGTRPRVGRRRARP